MNRLLAWTGLVVAMSVCPEASAQNVLVRAFNGATPLGTAATPFTPGSAIVVTGTTLGLNSADELLANKLVIGGQSGVESAGAVTVSLSAPSGGRPTVIEASSLVDLGGLISSSSRPIINFSLSISGNVSGAVTVESAIAVVVGGALNGVMTIGTTAAEDYEFGAVGTSGMLRSLLGSVGFVRCLSTMDGVLLFDDGSIQTLQIGTPTTAGRLGGTVIATTPDTGLSTKGRINLIRGAIGGPQPVIGSSIVSGDPTAPAKVYAKNGVGRVYGSKVYADIRGSGGFSETSTLFGTVSAPATTGSMQFVRATEWFKGSASAHILELVGGSNDLGVEVAGVFDGTLKFAKIPAYVLANDAPLITVGSVPTDPPSGYWLDLYEPATNLPSGVTADSQTGVLIGVKIRATSGRLGSIRARALAPRTASPAPSSPYSYNSFVNLRAAGRCIASTPDAG